MNVRAALLLLISFFAIAIPSAKALGTTPTEAQALREAAQNHTAYTLPPDKLELAKELFRDRTALHLLGEGWGILQLILLLALGVPARMRDVAEKMTKSRWGQCFVFVFLFLLVTALLNVPLRLF